MNPVVLFHSALGLRPGVHALAERLRAAGHPVTTPDLYVGATFEALEDGIAERDRIGIPTLLSRAEDALLPLGPRVVYAGLSMGAIPAQLYASTRPGAVGLVLLHGCLDPVELGVGRWPSDLPVQLHTSPGDPWVTPAEIDALAAAVPARLLEHHTYPGTGHLFSDPAQPEHDPVATALLQDRVLPFVDRLAGLG